MDAGGGQGQDDVAGLHLAVVDDLGLVHNAYGEAGQVIIIGSHGAGMLGGLAADEGAAGLDAALGNAGDQGSHLLGIILADGNVVQEENGLCAAADDIVDAHGNTVDTHGVVLAHDLGDALLGAHTIGAGDQNGLAHAGQIGSKEAAEAANIGNHAGDMGALDMRSHELNTFIAGSDIYASFTVAVRKTMHRGRFLSLSGRRSRRICFLARDAETPHGKVRRFGWIFILCRSSSRCRPCHGRCRWPPERPPGTDIPESQNQTFHRWS